MASSDMWRLLYLLSWMWQGEFGRALRDPVLTVISRAVMRR